MASSNMEKNGVPDGATIASPGDRTIYITNYRGNLLTKDILHHFSTFGDVEIVYWSESAPNAYVTFKDEFARNLALEQSRQTIAEEKVYVAPSFKWNNRIFVRGFLHLGTHDLKMYFEQFGEVEFIHSPRSQNEHVAIGFCYVVFSTERAAFNALLTVTHTINGKTVRIARAIPHHRRRARIFDSKEATYDTKSDDEIEMEFPVSYACSNNSSIFEDQYISSPSSYDSNVFDSSATGSNNIVDWNDEFQYESDVITDPELSNEIEEMYEEASVDAEY